MKQKVKSTSPQTFFIEVNYGDKISTFKLAAEKQGTAVTFSNNQGVKVNKVARADLLLQVENRLAKVWPLESNTVSRVIATYGSTPHLSGE